MHNLFFGTTYSIEHNFLALLQMIEDAGLVDIDMVICGDDGYGSYDDSSYDDSTDDLPDDDDDGSKPEYYRPGDDT